MSYNFLVPQYKPQVFFRSRERTIGFHYHHRGLRLNCTLKTGMLHYLSALHNILQKIICSYGQCTNTIRLFWINILNSSGLQFEIPPRWPSGLSVCLVSGRSWVRSLTATDRSLENWK